MENEAGAKRSGATRQAAPTIKITPMSWPVRGLIDPRPPASGLVLLLVTLVCGRFLSGADLLVPFRVVLLGPQAAHLAVHHGAPGARVGDGAQIGVGDDRGHEDDGEEAVDGGQQAVEGQRQAVLEDEQDAGHPHDEGEDHRDPEEDFLAGVEPSRRDLHLLAADIAAVLLQPFPVIGHKPGVLEPQAETDDGGGHEDQARHPVEDDRRSLVTRRTAAAW